MVEEIKTEVSQVENITENFLNKLQELREINSSIEKNIAYLKELRSSELMGSSAGIRKDEIAHEETAKEYADRIMKNKK